MKITGFEFKRFYNDPQYWQDNQQYWDGDIFVTYKGTKYSDANLFDVADDSLVDITNATVFLSEEHEGISLASYFRKWQKQQSIRHLLVEIHESKVTKVKSYIRSLGGKV